MSLPNKEAGAKGDNAPRERTSIRQPGHSPDAVHYTAQSSASETAESFPRQAVYAVLLFLLVREWILPLAAMSEQTDVHMTAPFLIGMGGFLLIGLLPLPGLVCWLLRLSVCLGLVGSLFFKASFPAGNWLVQLVEAVGQDAASAAAGNVELVSGAGRTLLFLLGWMLLLYVIQTMLSQRQSVLWLVGATLVYLGVLQLVPGMDTSGGLARSAALGLLLLGLSRFSSVLTFSGRGGQEAGLDSVHTARGWPWPWLAATIGATSALFCSGMFVSAVMDQQGASRLQAQGTAVLERLGWNWSGWEQLARKAEQIAFPLRSSATTGDASFGKARSGYGGSDSRLGGPLQLDSTVAFLARTPVQTYWRGESRNVYDGKGWVQAERQPPQTFTPENVMPNSEYTAPSGAGSVPVSLGLGGDGEQLRGSTNAPAPAVIEQEVLVQNRSLGGLLFAGGTIRDIQALIGEQGAVAGVEAVRLLPDGHKYDLSRFGEPASYYRLLVNPVVVLGSPDVQESRGTATAAAMTGYSPKQLSVQEREVHLQLPAGLPERVRQLASEITGGADGELDQAFAISRYLRAHYRYSLDEPGYPPGNGDFADYFLFEQQVGYCDHFSTAMTVLLRAAGIPARWVKGFAPGEVQQESSWMLGYGQEAAVFGGEQDGGQAVQTVTIRNSDAHSWVEAFIPGAGWVGFEPTPGYTGTSLHTAANGASSGSDIEAVPASAAFSPAQPLSSSAGQGAAPAPQAAALYSRGLGEALPAVYSAAQAAVTRAAALLWPAADSPIRAALAATLALMLLLGSAALARTVQRRLVIGRFLSPAFASGPEQRCSAAARRELRRFDRFWRRLFARLGGKPKGQTLREFARAQEALAPEQQAALAALVEQYETLRYSGQPLTAPERKQLWEYWRCITRRPDG
ncbi:DUF4129 domain-containing transglutaminase family protein [Paenibacillus sp. y28]|uniref:DUF4129 domain-containing transglutaminase family protein n=1 Tax=Paenibacillus sp. y28 TaxID=3129110 RepID=UPI00301A9033